jgi:hypothetical protein
VSLTKIEAAMPRRPETRSFAHANAAYERWLATHLRILRADLQRKHAAMAEAAFPFMRATYFRWAERWPVVCSGLTDAPAVLAVGDLHVENFGTWRDAEGRLIWGVNDFDEAWPLPYTSDLARLATSAILATHENHLSLGTPELCETLLEGYRAALKHGGRPFVLAEHHGPLRDLAVERLKDPEKFWQKLEAMPPIRGAVPARVRSAVRRSLPDAALKSRYVHRLSGLGSLGRERFVAIADWQGGKVAREAKALAPSASAWAADIPAAQADIHYRHVLEKAVRCPDPFLRVEHGWIVRRLAPDCARIDLAALPRAPDELCLLYSMGWEAANVHLGSVSAKTLLRDLKERPEGWLRHAAGRLRGAVESDFETWQGRHSDRAGSTKGPLRTGS